VAGFLAARAKRKRTKAQGEGQNVPGAVRAVSKIQTPPLTPPLEGRGMATALTAVGELRKAFPALKGRENGYRIDRRRGLREAFPRPSRGGVRGGVCNDNHAKSLFY